MPVLGMTMSAGSHPNGWMSGWKGALSVCYFTLIAMLALAIVFFVLGPTIIGIFLAVLASILGVAFYASLHAFGLGLKIANSEKIGHTQVATIISVVATVALAGISFVEGNPFFTAVFAGSTGGLVHEIAQSNGEFMLPQRGTDDNLYLGGLFGLVAGGVAGLLLIQGLTETIVSYRLLGEAFLGGLGLKGFADAVAAVRPQSKKADASSGGPTQ